MNTSVEKIYPQVLTFSIISLTAALVWLALVYYPKVANHYKTRVATESTTFKPVYANSTTLPIKTDTYEIAYEESSLSYYVFIKGNSYEEYVYNRENAKLTLKSALSIEDLCDINVFYISANNLKIPKPLMGEPNC